MAQKIFGIIPPMTTPFDGAGEIDEAAVRTQVRWLLEHGVHGLAAGGSTGEGHTLDADELKRLVATVVDETAGRVPVIAGVIVDSTRDAIRRGRALAGLGGPSVRYAAVLLGAQEGLVPPGHLLPPMERENLVTATELARSVLGDAVFAEAYAEGGGLKYPGNVKNMGFDEVVTYKELTVGDPDEDLFIPPPLM